MERCIIEEEEVTKKILIWLRRTGWQIVCYDYPQSGTGYTLKPNDSRSKNKGCINPDIVAVNAKSKVCLFFENKNRFYRKDFIKQYTLITDNQYTHAISNLLDGFSVDVIYYGIGLPLAKYTKMAEGCAQLVDFVVGVDAFSEMPKVLYASSPRIFEQFYEE